MANKEKQKPWTDRKPYTFLEEIDVLEVDKDRWENIGIFSILK